MSWERKDLHKSSFTFESFDYPQENPQKNQIYSYNSAQVKECLTNQPVPSSTQTHFYHNNIFHSTRKYAVPLEPAPRSPQDFQDFYYSHHKFTKPYGTLTKFTDSLNRNKSLLRRAQNNIPFAVPKPHAKQSNRLLRYEKVRKRKEKKGEANLSLTGFHLTLKEHQKVMQMRMEKGEKGVGQSLNRLLAAEMIQEQLRPRKRAYSKTEHN